MNTESQNNNDIREQDLEINLIDIFRLIFVNWYWFVLSVLICIGFAFCLLIPDTNTLCTVLIQRFPVSTPIIIGFIR